MQCCWRRCERWPRGSLWRTLLFLRPEMKWSSSSNRRYTLLRSRAEAEACILCRSRFCYGIKSIKKGHSDFLISHFWNVFRVASKRSPDPDVFFQTATETRQNCERNVEFWIYISKFWHFHKIRRCYYPFLLYFANINACLFIIQSDFFFCLQ